ncbi:hypothetical protein WJX75_002565 [Coccomyxa subellipsoidea]|uniref:Uncharacterized protein n=1 Tax=Coccomyxa subellipsoidea TaxID=248742 RepID=A0ABR2YVG9_9CHLO
MAPRTRRMSMSQVSFAPAAVERLTAEVARLKADGEAQSDAQAQLRQELAQKEELVRTGLAEREADSALARAEAQQLQAASNRAAAAAVAREEQLRRELKALSNRLERAEEVNPPPSVVSASSLAITILALLATSALAFWISAAKSARDQVQELEELRLQTEEQERRHREEKSMIGRLQNELVAANAERSKQYQELAATKRQLTFAEGQVAVLSSKVEERDSRLSAHQDCFDELDKNYMATKAEKDDLDSQKVNELEDRNRELEAAAAAAALESLASPSATTPQRPVPSRAKGSDKENTGSTQMNARRAVKVPLDVVLAENSAFRQQLEAFKRREQELTTEEAVTAGQLAEEEWKVEIFEMQDKLEQEIATTTELVNMAAIEKTITEQSLTDIMTKAEMLQEQRDMLVIQLSLAEEEQAAATQAAAIASAEAQMQDKLREMLEEELKAEEAHGKEVVGDLRGACDQVHGLLLRLTERLRYEDAEVEVDRRQSQVEELQRVRLQLEGQVEDLAAKLKDVDAENSQLKAEVADLRRQCSELEDQLLVKVTELTEAVKMKEHLSGLLEGNSSAMARLERDNENLEGQVDQLTISLVDATSKKSETDKRLRQYQQDLDEMELLMARAEEERRALESEVKHMRSTASEATSQLMLAEELARDLGESSPEADDVEVQSQVAVGPGAVQTPISAALNLMQKMDGVARLLGGSETPWYSSPASKASNSGHTSPAIKSAHLSQGGTARMINFMGRAAGKLGTLSRGMAAVEEEGSERSTAPREPPVLPSSSEASPRATPASILSKAAARVESEIVLSRVLKAELKGEDAGYDRVQRHLHKGTASGAAVEGASVTANRLQSLRTKMHEAFRDVVAQEAVMQQAAAQAAAAEEAAAASDAQYAAGQEELELLMKERAETEAAAGKASAAVEAANKQLADALQLKQAAEAALEEFEAKGLGAFGGGNDSAVVWRDRVDAQDAYAAAAQAKAAALQRKEEAMAAKRTVLARLEAAIHALTAAENGSADAAETMRAAAADLDDHVEATIQAQSAFRKARKAFADGVGADASETKDTPSQEKDSPGSVENQAQRANTRAPLQGLTGLLQGFTFKPAALSAHSASSPSLNNMKAGVSSTSLVGSDSNRSGRARKSGRAQLQDRNALVLMDNGWSGSILD